MTGEVDILAGPALGAADLAEIESELRQWGLGTRTSRMPARRGAEITWLVVMAFPAEAVAKAMLDKLGVDLYQGLRGLAQRVFGKHGRSEPGTVMIESANTGAQFALEGDLPLDAYRQLVDAIADRPAAGGVRTFDREQNRWRLSAAV